MSLLRIEALTRRFAGLIAVDGVTLSVEPGGLHAVIGPNGAGKTTLFNLISGLVLPSAGRLWLGEHEMTALRPEQRAALGMGRTFQNIRVFGAMTALENVLTGSHTRLSAGLGSVLFRTPGFRAEEKRAVDRARTALDTVGLADKADLRASGLSYGDQRRLEIARAIAPDPALLLLDEPAAGMNHDEVGRTAEIVRAINRTTSLIVVEHDMAFIRLISDRITVFNRGSVLMEDRADAVMRDQRVRDVYLGKKAA